MIESVKTQTHKGITIKISSIDAFRLANFSLFPVCLSKQLINAYCRPKKLSTFKDVLCGSYSGALSAEKRDYLKDVFHFKEWGGNGNVGQVFEADKAAVRSQIKDKTQLQVRESALLRLNHEGRNIDRHDRPLI